MSGFSLLVAGEPDQYTGGYLYDGRIADAARADGHCVDVTGLAGRFPIADDTARAALDNALTHNADGALVVIDGLALGTLGDVVAKHARRLVIVALVHHPLADEEGLDADTAATLYAAERAALAQVRHVIVTSEFTARRLQTGYDVSGERLSVVLPGVKAVARRTPARDEGHGPVRLLCVATLIPRKGHRVLVDALARLADRPWHCRLIGATDRDPACADDIRTAITDHGLAERIELAGSQPPDAVATAYTQADLFVLPSFYEGYGMVISEALAHGLPVVTTTGGALADTLPRDAGLAVPPGDVTAMAAALAHLIGQRDARATFAANAARAGAALPDWPTAARRFVAVLDTLRAAPV